MKLFELKNAITVMSFALLLTCTASHAAETNVLQTVRPMIAQVTKEFGQIPADRQTELKEIALYLKSKLAANETPQVTFICTHNSRRSHLAQVWAQTAAAYYDVPSIKTYSGGIEVTACNIRTVRALRRAGFSVVQSSTGTNPVYLIQYSDNAEPLRAFSKLYNQNGNPTNNYVAVMTCDDADRNCPVVEGSSMRVGVHYVDPKESDGKPEEEATYDERSRQIAREMFFMMSLAKP
jgi:protein-tyrosine-phosphatase